MKNIRDASSVTYKSVLVQQVVGQFEFLERHRLLGELLPTEGRVRVDVQSRGQWGVSLASDQPR